MGQEDGHGNEQRVWTPLPARKVVRAGVKLGEEKTPGRCYSI